MEYKGKYTNDQCDGAVLTWDKYFIRYKDRSDIKILEIVSYESRSTVFMVKNYLTGENYNVTCIDTFEGSMEHNIHEKIYRSRRNIR